jgi:hypothetical protein
LGKFLLLNWFPWESIPAHPLRPETTESQHMQTLSLDKRALKESDLNVKHFLAHSKYTKFYLSIKKS